LFSSVTAGDALAGLLPASYGEMPGGGQPVGQDGEGRPARPTDPTPNPDAIMLVVVGLAESPTVANDRVGLAERAQPRQEMQRDYPGSLLSLVSGSAIKRITAGVKTRR
jgi:hypothetical protein